MGFDVSEFVEKCRAARAAPDAPELIADLLRKAVADPQAIALAVGARHAGGAPPLIDVFVNEDDLTIYNLAFPPHLFGVPHDHAGWAVVGVYSGAECFSVYAEQDGALVRTGRDVVKAPAVQVLPAELIHDIENPSAEASGSIHVYSNRHFDIPQRRIWRNEQVKPEPFSVEKSFAYGMERSMQRRQEEGIDDTSGPTLPPNLASPSPR